MPISDYNTSAALNLLLGTIPVGPGMEREKVNNAFQQIMADIAVFAGPAGGAATMTFLQAGTGAVARTMQTKQRETVNIMDFGAVPNSDAAKFTNDTALANARAYIASTGAELRFAPGTYTYTISPNWAIGGARIIADGNVTLRLTDTAGHAVKIDGAAGDAVNVGSEGVHNLTMTGFKVESQQYSDHPVFIRAAHQSKLGFWVRGGNPTKHGVHIQFCVSTSFWLHCNALDTGVWYTNGIPNTGIYLTHNGNTANPVSYCQFFDPGVAGTVLGMRLHSALGCSIYGGALQGCTDTGLYLDVAAILNKFRGTDMEVNAVDVVVVGANNTFDDIDTEKTFRITAGANNLIKGGNHAQITIDSGSVANVFEGVRYARTNPNGTPSGGVITDNGTRTRFSNTLDLVTQKVFNRALTETVLTVGASPYTYVNTSGANVRVLVRSGTVSSIDYAPQNVVGRLTGMTTGMFTLRPGDALIVAYTVAPIAYLYVD